MEAENKNKADVIDCKRNGYKGLSGAVIKDRYMVLKSLSEGAHGYIYVTEDTKPVKEEKTNALKVQEDEGMASSEIATMRKFKQVIDANRSS